MKAFIFIVGSADKTQTTLYKAEGVTLETVKLLETLEQYDLLESDIESRACHRHFRCSNGTSLTPHLPRRFSLLSVPFLVLVARTEILPTGLMVPSGFTANLFFQYLLKVLK
jgi:hypothetical protein